MITQEQIKHGEELLKTLIHKSWDNPEFKSQLVNNPKETIGKTFGQDLNLLNKEQKIVVEDQTDEAMIYLNIPRKIDLENIELTDEQLETVSGGDFITGALIAVAVIGGVAVVALGVGIAVGYYVNRE